MRSSAQLIEQSDDEPVAKKAPIIRHISPPKGVREKVMSRMLRTGVRLVVKPFFGPPWPAPVMRAALHVGSMAMPQDLGAKVRHVRVGEMPVERITPVGHHHPRQAVLYLHGGAFSAGSPRTHRSITRRLCALTGALVLVPHYRRIPEHQFPVQLEDCVEAYRDLLRQGYTADRIAVVGDSAGGNLSFMLPGALRLAGLPMPAAVVMMSPVLSSEIPTSGSAVDRAHRDPMIRLSLGHQVMKWSKIPHGHPMAVPKEQDLSSYPPSLIQVGDDEVLLDDAHWAVEALTQAGAVCSLEVYHERWHVFQVHAGLLHSADQALLRQAEFIQQHLGR